MRKELVVELLELVMEMVVEELDPGGQEEVEEDGQVL